jgi:hypothetical protein
MEDIGRVVQRLPPFGQIGFHEKGARWDPCSDLMPQEPAIDETHGAIRLEVGHKLVVKVGRVVAAHAQDTATLGLTALCPPQGGGTR